MKKKEEINKNILSQEQSKILWDKGLRLETEKYWYYYGKYWGYRLINDLNNEMKATTNKPYYPAPSTHEMLEALPQDNVLVHKSNNLWHLDNPVAQHYVANKSIPEALGLMLEYLINNNLMEVK